MAIRKQDLREAYETSINHPFNEDGIAAYFYYYAVGLLIVSGIVTIILVSSLGVGGMIIGVVVQLITLRMITTKLFETVNKLISSRMKDREKELLEAIDKRNNR